MKIFNLLLLVLLFACEKSEVKPTLLPVKECYSSLPTIGYINESVTVKDFYTDFLLRNSQGDWYFACNLPDSCKIDGLTFHLEAVLKQYPYTDSVVSVGAPIVIKDLSFN